MKARGLCIAAMLSAMVTQSVAQTGIGATVRAVRDRQCSVANLASDAEARYAASIGVIAADADMRARYLSRTAAPQGAEICAGMIADDFCGAEVFARTVGLVSGMGSTARAPQAFFAALDATETVENPSGNQLAATGGVAGAILGGVLGAGDGLGGMAKGAAVVGLAGMAGGGYLDKQRAVAQCRQLQSRFDAMADRLLTLGLRPDGSEAGLLAEMRRIEPQLNGTERQTLLAMQAAMQVTADRIEAGR